MNSRELFEWTMAHEGTDELMLDIGATTLTSMSKGCEKGLCDYLGFEDRPTRDDDRIDERILEWAGTDFRAVGNIVQLPSEHSKKISETEYVDCWGIRQRFVDRQWQIVNSPLRNATVADVKAYPWPTGRIDDGLMEKWRDKAKELKEDGEYVVIAEHPYFGILELGMWLFGYDVFMMNMAANPDLVKVFFEIITNIQLTVAEQYYGQLGEYIDLTTSGDDFGSQRAPMMSAEMFDELISPFFAERIRRTKELGQCYYWHHREGMEPEKLKAEFGGRMVFWGGVDVQQFLPNARAEQVAEYVDYLRQTLGKNGGYVVAGAHNMQDDVPAENIVALVEAVKGL